MGRGRGGTRRGGGVQGDPEVAGARISHPVVRRGFVHGNRHGVVVLGGALAVSVGVPASPAVVERRLEVWARGGAEREPRGRVPIAIAVAVAVAVAVGHPGGRA